MTGYSDADGDGHAGTSATVCTAGTLPTGYSATSEDCDDSDAARFQTLTGYGDADGDGAGEGAAQQFCTGASLPAGAFAAATDCAPGDASKHHVLTGHADSDGDTYGAAVAVQVCSGAALPAGYVNDATDCDDTQASQYQLLNGYVDSDGDGRGAAGLVQVCAGTSLPSTHVANNIDCDDTNTNVWNTAQCATCADADSDGNFVGCDRYESVSGPDCDDTNDDVYRLLQGFADNDADGVVALTSAQICSGADLPSGFVSNPGADCDDNNAMVNPSMPELGTVGGAPSLDENCDGTDLVVSDATGIFVSPSGADTNPGTQASPKLTISAALAAASTSQVVFVAEGTYTEQVFVTRSLYGGFSATDWSRDIAGRVTTLQASGTNLDYTLRSDAASAAVQGFTILGPITDNPYARAAEQGSGLLVLSDDIITGCSGGTEGTGFQSGIAGNFTYIVKSTISGGTGAGLASYAVRASNFATVDIRSSTLRGGSGSSAASAGLQMNSNPWVYVRFSTLEGGSGGAGSYGIDSSDGTLLVIRSSLAGGSGAEATALRAYGNDTVDILNSVLLGGTGATASKGVEVGASNIDLVNNIINGGASSAGSSIGVYGTGTLARLINNNISAGAGAGSNRATEWTHTAAVYLVNNIVDAAGGTNSRALFMNGTPSSPNLYLYNNDFVAPGGATLLEAPGVDDGSGSASVAYTDAAEINACISSLCDTSTNNIAAVPLLGAGQTLSANTPCHGTGTDPAVVGYTESFTDSTPSTLGTARPQGNWDIGVDEIL